MASSGSEKQRIRWGPDFPKRRGNFFRGGAAFRQIRWLVVILTSVTFRSMETRFACRTSVAWITGRSWWTLRPDNVILTCNKHTHTYIYGLRHRVVTRRSISLRTTTRHQCLGWGRHRLCTLARNDLELQVKYDSLCAVNNALNTVYSAPGRGTEYCDDRVCVLVCYRSVR